MALEEDAAAELDPRTLEMTEAGVDVGTVTTKEGVPLGVVERPCAPLRAELTELAWAAGVTELNELLDVT